MAKGNTETVAPAAAVANPPGIRPVKKLTVRDILGGPPDIKAIILNDEKDPGSTYWLVEVIGIATGYRPGTISTSGQTYVRFLGTFKGVNLLTGQMFLSGACILPGAIPDLLFSALQMGNAAQFGFKIGVRFDASAVTKYVYVVESLTKQAATDPLTLLEQAVRQGGELPDLPPLAGTPALPAEIGKGRQP